MSVLHIKDFPDDLHRAARIAAIEDEVSLRELVIQAVRREVGRRGAERRSMDEALRRRNELRHDDEDDD
ncbi:MAG TPA: hypothetical protein VFI46_00745 [Jiangellaceae bacterium]|nr:hypothetical protein [Jiangellaceae bacterium]